MKIVLAPHSGFCFGVKRATNMAFDAVAEADCTLCSLGPIIHSPQLVARLEEKGVTVVDQVEGLVDGSVILRSHGVRAEELAAIRQRGLTVIDATCPFVKKAQEHAALLSREGYDLLLVGEREHPEVQGILSYAAGGKGQVFVVADRAAAAALPLLGRLGVVAQTTQSPENLRQIVEVCIDKCKELRVFNTICDATAVRQDEARRLAGEVEVMLVVGGYNSANTRRLAQVCLEVQPRTHHIETAAEIDPGWFVGIASVGVTAGASTPRWIIDEVMAAVAAAAK
ncbi:MAG: 4-hydroxy-3-methylbut-2-enyl diphosphate reductase [Desulfuromonadales bacterium GWD2_61_12]|nr:MAG: 4-hydroxy-3-methylbut-2-enyl diphosphate reductase [Desulfuromonadales bacterium GWC2_61_20]OGR34679.1 MAG: 4-hydroxy-3-methylbut-2-enyl diphosphate reductase [Desulfuromonadales bacterium GWD2_61_12]HAD04179.1 4-hydroxy-3-methylbut-2-enyl diphosphate reductase [Desulfuromonas sp.]HBT84030.1 4-hydroxy-3-methylbut-2-enyl diphosphate reductase [Desulfuromonas sp.]